MCVVSKQQVKDGHFHGRSRHRHYEVCDRTVLLWASLSDINKYRNCSVLLVFVPSPLVSLIFMPRSLPGSIIVVVEGMDKLFCFFANCTVTMGCR